MICPPCKRYYCNMPWRCVKLNFAGKRLKGRVFPGNAQVALWLGQKCEGGNARKARKPGAVTRTPACDIAAPKTAALKGKGDGKPGKCGQAYGAHCSRPGRKRNVRKRQRSLPMRENPNRGVRAEQPPWQYAAPDAAKSANGHQKQFVLQTCGASPGTAKACATALDPRLWHGERRIDKKKRIPACAMFRSRNPKNSLQNGLGRKQRNGPLQVLRSKAFRAPSIPLNFQPNLPCQTQCNAPGRFCCT